MVGNGVLQLRESDPLKFKELILENARRHGVDQVSLVEENITQEVKKVYWISFDPSHKNVIWSGSSATATP